MEVAPHLWVTQVDMTGQKTQIWVFPVQSAYMNAIVKRLQTCPGGTVTPGGQGSIHFIINQHFLLSPVNNIKRLKFTTSHGHGY